MNYRANTTSIYKTYSIFYLSDRHMLSISPAKIQTGGEIKYEEKLEKSF